MGTCASSSHDVQAALGREPGARRAVRQLPPASRACVADDALLPFAAEALVADARAALAGATPAHPADDPVERLLAGLPARRRAAARALAARVAADEGPLRAVAFDPFPRTFPARPEKARGAVDTEAALVDLVLDAAGWRGDGRVLEPAAGRGLFLVRAWERALDAGRSPADAAAAVTGVELHPFACRAARLRLACAAAARGLAGAPLPAVHLGDALDDDPRWRDGFDLVVGNPPYVRGERLPSALRATLRARWPDLGAGNVDLAAYFVRRALEWLAPGGRVTFVLTQGLCDARSTEGLRARLAGCALEALVGFEWAPPQFVDASVIPCVLVARRGRPAADHEVALGAATAEREALSIAWTRVRQREWLELGRGRWPIEVRAGDLPLLRALHEAPRPLVAGYGLAIRTRVGAGALIAHADDPAAARFESPRPLLDGREVRPWSIEWSGRVIDYRKDAISDPKTEAFFAAPKVVLARIALTTQAAVDDSPDGPFFARNTVMIVRAPGTVLDDEPHALCAVLNSLPVRVHAFLIHRAGALAGSHRATFYSGVIGALPVPAALLHDRARARDLAALARAARDAARARDHDLLAARQAEVDDLVGRAFGLDAATLADLRARAAELPLSRILRGPRSGAPVRRIAVQSWAAGARYLT